MICFPELCLTGYGHSEAMVPWCQPIPGPATQELIAIAQDHNTILVAGLAELGADGGYYIAQVVATPNGLAGVYRKTHLSPTERPFFSAGDDLGVVDLDSLRLGLQLCYDTHFPELSRVQALSGATVLCAGFASPRDDPQTKAERLSRYLGARAYDNGCFLIACHLLSQTAKGKPLAGVALILDPKGRVMAQTAGWHEDYVMQTLRVADIQRLRASRMGYFMRHRRPELYSAISQNQSLDQGVHDAATRDRER